MTRILVTGSRNWDDLLTVRVALADVLAEHPGEPATLVVGDCPTGADAMAVDAWAELGQPHRQVHTARWSAEGKAAGPRRNQRMVDSGADICLAFLRGDSRGTRDCIARAGKAGIPVRAWTHVDPPRGDS